MKLKYINWLLVLGLAMSLPACTDHRLGGSLSPAQLRLKTVSGSLNRTYTYDSRNRLATATTAAGALDMYVYDEVQQSAQVKRFVNPADQTQGTRITFPYTFPNQNFTINYYSFSSTTAGLGNYVDQDQYAVNPSNPTQVSSIRRYTLTNPLLDRRSYQYTGDNVTNEGYSSGRIVNLNRVYEYDSNINPFFGSTDPDLTDIQRLSRNNVVKVTTTDPVNAQYSEVVSYSYEYNQQGLPTKRTTTQGGTDVTTYSYESY